MHYWFKLARRDELVQLIIFQQVSRRKIQCGARHTAGGAVWNFLIAFHYFVWTPHIGVLSRSKVNRPKQTKFRGWGANLQVRVSGLRENTLVSLCQKRCTHGPPACTAAWSLIRKAWANRSECCCGTVSPSPALWVSLRRPSSKGILSSLTVLTWAAMAPPVSFMSHAVACSEKNHDLQCTQLITIVVIIIMGKIFI